VPACRSEAEIPHLRGWRDFFDSASNGIGKTFALKKFAEASFCTPFGMI